MTNKVKSTISHPKSLSAQEKAQAIAEINARVQRGDIDAEGGQAEIDGLNGVKRLVDDTTGNIQIVDAAVVETPQATSKEAAAPAKDGVTKKSDAGS